MIIKEQFIPKSATGRRPGWVMDPDYITIHSTTSVATAQNEADNLCNNNPDLKVSFHAAIDDKGVVQTLPWRETAWHAGDDMGTGNLRSIGIEICEGGDRKKALTNAAELVRILMKEFNIDRNHVTTHQRWSGKPCPRILVVPEYIKNGLGWSYFLSLLEPAKEHWAARYLRSLISKGLIRSPEAHSDLDKPITKGELFALLDRMSK